jgi:hypothetical protein
MLFVNTFNCISLTIYSNFFVCLNVFNSKRIKMLKTHLIYTLLLFTLGACNAQQTPTKKILWIPQKITILFTLQQILPK